MKYEVETHDDVYWSKKRFKDIFYLMWQVIFGLPKSILFNVRYFGIQKGIRLPVLCSYKVKLSKLSGRVIIKSEIHTAMIKLGFTAPETYNNSKLSFIWVNDGIVIFKGSAGIKNGTSIRNYGVLTLGDSFHVSSPSTIICYKEIEFGQDTLIGWNCEFCDGDAHKIYFLNDVEENRNNIDKKIKIGDHVWFCANSKVYKGVELGNNVVVAGSSVVVRSVQGDNQVIGGNPARVLRKEINWKV